MLCASGVIKDATPASIGPHSSTGRRPTLSISTPVGNVAASWPAFDATNTSEATPTPTSNDLASPGITGATRLVPSESSTEGRYSDRTWFMETSPSERGWDIEAPHGGWM